MPFYSSVLNIKYILSKAKIAKLSIFLFFLFLYNSQVKKFKFNR